MLITDAATQSGLSQDTIRFYEKSGMLPPIARDDRGWRQFSAQDLGWLTVLERLRATGMPLDDVKRFAVSAHAPDCDTAKQRAIRLALLQDHAKTLERRRAELDACQRYLDHKINIYSTALENKNG